MEMRYPEISSTYAKNVPSKFFSFHLSLSEMFYVFLVCHIKLFFPLHLYLFQYWFYSIIFHSVTCYLLN